MSELDFSAARRIEELLASSVLEDLVAVFSRASGGRMLLVYNSDTCPAPTSNNCEVILLEEIGEVDLGTYDGLLAGFSVLDVIRTDLSTRGPGFYPLERVFLKLGRRDALHLTLNNLTRYLVGILYESSEEDSPHRRRIEFKILQLSMPSLLDRWGADGLIGVLPGTDMARFVSGDAGRRFTYRDDLSYLEISPGDEWIIALEEIRHLVAGLASEDGQKRQKGGAERFVDLRGVLRLAGYEDCLCKTCRALACRFAKEAADRPELWQPAWELMAESWLMMEDVDDLVAFFPHADFEHFSVTGEGLRFYRTLDEEAAVVRPGPRRSLGALASKGIPPEFRRCGFSVLPPKTPLPESDVAMEMGDLGWLLWKSGHATSLMRTLWLLARDGLSNAPVAGNLPPETLTGLVTRAMIIISLGDPWSWRQGRYLQLLSGVYRTLRETLIRQVVSTSAAAREYYNALVVWYGLYNTGQDDLENLLRQMTADLRSFLRSIRDEVNAPHRNEAQQLIEVGQSVVYPPATLRTDEKPPIGPGDSLLPGDLDRMRGAASMNTNDVMCLSPVFVRGWTQLMHLSQERRQVQMVYERNVDVLQRRLEALLIQARKTRSLIFAPLHEMAVLRFIYEREVMVLEAYLRELKTEARLDIIPLNPWVEFQREVQLVFDLTNSGRVEARYVDVVLEQNQTFELLDRSSVHEFPRLPPGVPHKFSYHVRPLHQSYATFKFSYKYAGMEESQEMPPIHLPVHSLDEAPFKMKGDPYKFGRAIQNPTDFYGREEEIKEVLSSLYRGGHKNFLLLGPRRMGKTSMLYMLRHALEDAEVRRRFQIPPEWDTALDNYIPIMLDLQEFGFQDDYTHVKRFFYTLLDGICDTIAPDIRADLLERFERREREVDAARAVLEQLKEVLRHRPDSRVVVLLDEYDEIYRPQGRILDAALRHVVQEEQRLTWIIASTQFLFKESKSYGSPWFNILNIVELACLSHREARRLIEEPSRDEEVEWLSGAIVDLLEETGRHPAFLQLFCSKIMSYLNRKRRNYVLPKTIATLAEQIVQERETIHSHFEFYWVDTPGVGQLILLVTDDNEEPPNRPFLRKWVFELLKDRFGAKVETHVQDPITGNVEPWWKLQFDEGITWVSQVVNAVSFDKASRTYSFTVPLFRHWLQRRRRHEELMETALGTVRNELERDGII